MQRISITIDDDLLDALDRRMERQGHASRSEAIRDMIRNELARSAAADGGVECVAILGFVYDHEIRALAQRLTRTFHSHHDLSTASMHVHLDHAACLEVAVLRGKAAAVRTLADALAAQRGVRHSSLQIIPARMSTARHDHGSGVIAHSHTHA